MRRHLVIFAKAPRLGAVKRRLAKDLGPVRALKFYRACLDGVLRRLARDRRWQTTLAVTPEPANWPRHLPRIDQGKGDLGQRMARVARRMPTGPVVIVGADIPDIMPHHVADAFRRLGAADAVLGPADDGGYWLIGFRRRPPIADPFAGARWSSEHALDDTLAAIGPRYRVDLLETLIDIDDVAAWKRWRASQRVD